MPISKQVRDFFNYLYIFSTINDDFVVNHFGGMALKVILGIFVLVNINSLLSFKYTSPNNVPFFCFAVALFTAMAVNIFRYADITLAINSFIAISMIFIVFSQEKNPEKYLWGYVVAALFSAFLCITATDTVGEFTFRKTGGTEDPNEFSMTVLIPMGFLFGKILKSSNVKTKIAIVSIILIYSISLLFAGSKSAILVLGVFITIFIGYIITVYKTNHRPLIITGVILLAVSIGFVLNEYFGDTLQMLIGRFDKTGTAEQRFLSWEAGYELFTESPFFGVGLGNYANMVGLHFHSIVEGSRAAHNMYVQAIVELGIAGFITYIWFIFNPLVRQVRYKIYPLEIILGYIPLLLMGFTLSLLMEKYVWIFYAFLYNQNLFIFRTKHENS